MASASSMPSSDQRQDLKSLLECSVCLETFDDPRTLHCLHSFCKKCLENFVEGKREDELNCPVCRCKFTLDKEGKNITFTLKYYLHTEALHRASHITYVTEVNWRENQRGELIGFSYSEIRFLNKNIVKYLKIKAWWKRRSAESVSVKVFL